ncbi:MAG: tRNA lysidine(34) synthetase TilS [Oscillospiraceae bacterium]
MIEKAREAFARYSMTKRGDRVLACVSGGADSVALLFVLLELRDEIGISELTACHFNHGLRGQESDLDETFVRALCARIGVDCIVSRADMSARDKPQGKSVESWARELRYDFFETIATERDCFAATAHTSGDVAETVLFNLVRGAGIKGVAGIPPVRGRIIRPFIEATRTEIERYLERRGEKYVTDSTNSSCDYSRNRIRTRVLPELGLVNDAAALNIAKFARRARDISEYIDSAVADAIENARCAPTDILGLDGILSVLESFSALSLLDLDPLVRELALKSIAESLREDVDERCVELACRVLVGELHEMQLAENRYLRRDGDTLSVIERQHVLQQNYSQQLILGDNALPGGQILTIERAGVVNFKNICNNDLKNVADCDKIVGKLVARSRKEGDAYSPRGRNVTKTLKKIMHESGVSAQERSATPVVCDDSGIVWTECAGVSSGHAAGDGVRNIIKFSVSRKRG